MANEVDRKNAMVVALGERKFYPAGDNVYITDATDGLVTVVVKVDGKPWDSNVFGPNKKRLQVERKTANGKEMVDKLPSQVFASTKGAVKLNAAGQMLSLNCYIPADYGKVERMEHEAATLEQAFGKMAKK